MTVEDDAAGLGAVRWVRDWRWGLSVLAAFVLSYVAAAESGLSRNVALTGFDAHQSLAPRERQSAPVVVVAIDDASIARHGQWPWPRILLARLVDAITGPAAVGIELLMLEPDRLSPHRLHELTGTDPALARRLPPRENSDAVLASALRRHRAVLGVAGVDSDPLREVWLPRHPSIQHVGPDPLPWVRRFPGAVRSIDEITRGATGEGHLNAGDERGRVRRVALVVAFGSVLVPAFDVELLRVASGAPGVTVRTGPKGIESIVIGDLVVPTQPDGSVWLHYAGHRSDRFVSAADVLAAKVPPETFHRKLVLIGVTALGLASYHDTPIATMTGTEIHAELLESILDGTLVSRTRGARWLEAAAFAVSGLALTFAVPRLSFRWSAALCVVLIGMLLGSGFVVFRLRMLFDALSPAIGLALLYISILGVTLTQTQVQQRRLRRGLQREREAAARIAGELDAARRIQMGSLPAIDQFRDERRFRVAAVLEPAREVGGDLYDFFLLEDRYLCFLIGDVSGKGLPGALLMAASKSLCKSVALRFGGDPARVLRQVNLEISRENHEGMFVALLVGVLDAETGRLEWCNAGHEPPYLLRPAGRPDRLNPRSGGPPLCVIEDFDYSASVLQLNPGETLCMVTDGITESMNAAGDFYGRGRLENVLGRIEADPDALVRTIRGDVAAFAGSSEPVDDIAVLAIQWRGPDSAPPSPLTSQSSTLPEGR